MVKRIFATCLACLLLLCATACDGNDPVTSTGGESSSVSDLPSEPTDTTTGTEDTGTTDTSSDATSGDIADTTDPSGDTAGQTTTTGGNAQNTTTQGQAGTTTGGNSKNTTTQGQVTTTTQKQVTTTTAASTQEKKAISWWTTDPGNEASKHLDKALTEFETSTGITVNMYIQPNSGGTLTNFDDKFIPAMSAGNGPDVVSFNYVNTDYALDITSKFDTNFWNEFFPMVRDSLKLDGKYYSTPSFLSVNGLLLYSKVDFKNAGLDPNSPPTTIAQLDSVASKLYKANSAGDGYTQVGFYPWYWLMMEYPQLLVKPFGGAWTNAEGYPTANSAEVIAALEWMMGYVDDYGKTKVDTSLSTLVNENNSYGHALAMSMSFSAQLNSMKDENTNASEWGVSVFPGVDSKHNGLSIGLSAGYSVVKGSDVVDEAVKFLKFMSTDYQKKYVMPNYNDFGSYATNQSAWKACESSLDDFTAMMYNNVLCAASASDVGSSLRQTKYTVPATYMTQVKNSIKKILNKEVEIKAEMDSLQRRIAAQTKTAS